MSIWKVWNWNLNKFLPRKKFFIRIYQYLIYTDTILQQTADFDMIVIVYEENPDLENILNDKENGIQNIIKYWTGKVISPSYYFSSVLGALH